MDKAFLKFDKDCNGYIDASDLKYPYPLIHRGVFNGKMHPKVKSGEKTEDQVFMEFLQHFGDKNKDGKIERVVLPSCLSPRNGTIIMPPSVLPSTTTNISFSS